MNWIYGGDRRLKHVMQGSYVLKQGASALSTNFSDYCDSPDLCVLLSSISP